MSESTVSAEELASARDSMIKAIQEQMTRNDKDFLLSFKSGDPDWSLLNLDGIDQLPAVQWKLVNIRKMVKENAPTICRTACGYVVVFVEDGA